MASGTKTKGGCSFKLLWTNSSPTTDYSASTVPLDLTEYGGVLIVFLATANIDRQSSMIVRRGVQGLLYTAVPSATTTRTRLANVTDTGVVFGTGYSGSSTSAGSAIPYKIFGVKGI